MTAPTDAHERHEHLTIRKLERRAHELHEIENEGESNATPILAGLGVLMLVVPVLALMLGLAFGAYYVFR